MVGPGPRSTISCGCRRLRCRDAVVTPRGPTVRVPASTANLGAGFDVFGLAVSLHADLGPGDPPDGTQRLDRHHPASIAYAELGGDGPIWMRTSVPMGRGLGFSGVARVGGAALAVATAGDDPERAVHDRSGEILRVAAHLEGHGDNVSASLYGGTTAWIDGRVVRLDIGPHLQAATLVVWIPTATTSTDRSRATLAPLVDRPDVVHNIGRAVQFALAVERDDPSLLAGATSDRIHQTNRLAVVPGAAAALEAGQEAGAWCGWLSGSGPTVAFLCPSDAAASVEWAMPSDGHTKLLRIDTHGTHVV